MTASKKKMDQIAEYKRNHIKRIAFEVQREYWETVLWPAIEASGLSANGFIKEAIAERIERLQSESKLHDTSNSDNSDS